MTEEKVKKSKLKLKLGLSSKGILFLLLLMVIIIPVLMYSITFGFHITSDHARWAEFGAYISGIYTPVLSLATILVLLSQSKMQSKMNVYQIQQSTISKVENHNTQYLESLNKSLEATFIKNYINCENYLKSEFLFLAYDDIFTKEKLGVARDIYKFDPKILDCWTAINTGLTQLHNSEGITYKAAFSNEKLRVQSIISFGTCLALDNFAMCLKAIPSSQNAFFSDVSQSEAEVSD